MTVNRFNNQNYEKLKADCQRNGRLFVDSLFPANDSVLFKSKRMAGIEWKRPHELCNDPKLVVDGISSRDVIQGQLGNCWFVAAVSVLTTEKKNWERVIPDLKEQELDLSRPERYAGIYKFRFWQFGQWTEEKAYAKLNGCYEHLDGGNLSEALQDFTGGVCETITLNQENRSNRDQIDQETLFETMKKAIERRSLMACAINARSTNEIEQKLSCGLIKGHAYGITKLNSMAIKGNNFFKLISSKEKLQMIRLRNPWGSSEWSGPWSDQSENWKKVPKSEREKMGLNFDNDGEFWMELADFLSYFSEVSICRVINTSLLTIRKTWSESLVFGRWHLPHRAGGCVNNRGTFCDNPQFMFDINSDSDKAEEVIINLDQMSARSIGKDNLTIGFFLMRVEDNRKYRLHQAKPKVASSSFVNARSVFVREKIPNGRYVCIPSTFEPQVAGQFLLRIYSDDDNGLRELSKDCPVPFLYNCNPFAKYASCVTSITVKSASGLKNLTSNGAFDSYVCVRCEGKSVSGRVVRNSLSPEWNTSAIFYRYSPRKSIQIEVWIRRAIKDEFYGQISLEAEPDNRHVMLETSLTGRKQEEKTLKPGRLSLQIQSMTNITSI